MTWVVSFDLIESPELSTRFWTRVHSFDLKPVDFDVLYFWGCVAYRASHFIEEGQVSDRSTGELYSVTDEAAEHAKRATKEMVEPEVGQICWRFGSPPYEGDTSDDAFQTRYENLLSARELRRTDEEFAGTTGVRYLTASRPGTTDETRLQAIQSELSGGVVAIGDNSPIPQLQMVYVRDRATTPSSIVTVTSLWTPKELAGRADQLLRDAGYYF